MHGTVQVVERLSVVRVRASEWQVMCEGTLIDVAAKIRVKSVLSVRTSNQPAQLGSEKNEAVIESAD